jgi:iron complex outermembrane receptor protein
LNAQKDSCKSILNGEILDVDTKKPIPFALVRIKGTDKSSMTNLEGEFKIDGLCSERNTLVISCFGYCDSICENHYQNGEMPQMFLTQNVHSIDQVTINIQVNKANGAESLSQVSIEKNEIEINPTQSLAAILENQQGVSLASTGTNIQLPIIHGLYGNRIMILNNGLKHGFQNWGRGHAPEIDASSAYKITVVKGAAGVRFGPEALGGAVLVESDPLHLQKPMYVLLGSGFQTNGKGYNLRFGTGKGGENWSYFVNGNFTKIGDRNTPKYMLTNTGKDDINIGFGTRYYTKKWDFKLRYSLTNQNLGLLRASFTNSPTAIVQAFNSEQPNPAYTQQFSYIINEPNQLVQHHLAKAEVKWKYSEHANLTLIIGKQLNNRQEFDVRRNSHLPIIDLSLYTNDYQLEWEHPDWFGIDGLMGMQYFHQDNDNNPGTGTTAYIPNYNSRRYSLFIVESKKFHHNLFEVGVRGDLESNKIIGREVNQDLFKDDYMLMNLTSSIGYVRNFGKSNSFRTNIGTAWRAPNMAELYSYGQNGFKSSFGLLRYYFNNASVKSDQVIKMADSGIEPEKGVKFINELNINKKKHSHVLTGYAHYLQNYIFERPYTLIGTFRGPQTVFLFDQADVFFTGIDYSWNADWTKQLEGTFGCSYLWSRNISDSEPTINQPPVTLNYKIDWSHKLWKFTKSNLTLRSFYRFKQFQAPRAVTLDQIIEGGVDITPESQIFDFKSAPEGYFMINLSWLFEWKAISGGVTINNLLNTSYRDYLNSMRYFADAPGTNVLVNLNYKFNFKSKLNKF